MCVFVFDQLLKADIDRKMLRGNGSTGLICYYNQRYGMFMQSFYFDWSIIVLFHNGCFDFDLVIDKYAETPATITLMDKPGFSSHLK